jgi:chromosome segregation ATPase
MQESMGLVGDITADASFDAYLGHLSAIRPENKSLRLECMQLKADISSVRRDQQHMLHSLKQFDALSGNDVNTDNQSEGSCGDSLMQVAAITSPVLNPRDKNSIAKYAAYLLEVKDQTTDLRRQRAQLKVELERRQAELAQLTQDYDTWKAEFMNTWKAEFMIRHKQLMKTAVESMKP